MDFNFDTGTIDTISTLDTTEASPLVTQTNVLTIIGNGAITLPQGTTAQEPSPAVAGMFRFNTDTLTLEYFDGTVWDTLSTTGNTVSSFQTTLSGLTPQTPTTGAVTLSGTLGVSSGGTGSTATPTAGQIPVGTSGGTYTPYTITTGTGISIVTGSGTLQINNSGVTSIAGTAGNISVNGLFTPQTGAVTVNLVAVGTPVSNAFVNITTDTFGRVTATTLVTAGQLETIIGTFYLETAGGSMTGSITFPGTSGITVTGLPTPINPSDAANKAYVDAAINGLSWKDVAMVATTANITLSGLQLIDGYTTLAGDRVLVKNQTAPAENGIYIAATGAWSRSPDTNTGVELQGAAVYIDQGTTQGNTGYVQTTEGPITIGTTPIVWVQFMGSGTYTAGTGITITGTVISLTTPVSLANGGTNSSLTGSAGSIIYNDGTSLVNSTVGTTGYFLTSGGVGPPTWSNPATTVVTSFQTSLSGLTPQTATTGAVTLAGTLNSTSGGTGTATAPTAGQVLVGTSGGEYVPFTITTGTGISTTTGSGTLQINNTGVTSLIAGTGINVSSATGAVTVSNTGVLSFSAGTTGLTPNTATTGAVTLAGTLVVANGGTGDTTLTLNGVLYGNGTSPVGVTAAGLTGQVLTGNTGSPPTWAAASAGFVTSITGTANEIAANGVFTPQTGAVTLTLPATVITPGSLQVTTSFQFSATDAITAAGVSQGTATVLTTDLNIVTTVPAGTGVVLPAGLPGRQVTIANEGANPLLVYPALGAAIDGLAVNAPITVPVGQVYMTDAISATQWYSSILTTVAGTGISVTTVNGVLTITNTGVTSFSAGTTGFTPATSTTGAVTLAGTLGVANGGTGDTTFTLDGVLYGNGTSPLGATAAGTTGQVLVGNTGTAPSFSTLTTIAVTSITGTANQIAANGVFTAQTGAVTLTTPTVFIAPGSIASTTSITATTALTLTYGTPNAFLYSGAASAVLTTAAATNGQILIGSTGAAPVANTIATSGVGISVTNGAGTITLANTGVTSIIAGTGISVSGATGAVTVSNTGVLSVSLNDTSTTPIYTTFPTTATTGAVAETITLNTQTANTVFAGPASGGATQPTFRTLVYADVVGPTKALKLYVENPVSPIAPVATGTNAQALGSGASQTIFNSKAFAGGDFATSGDAQEGLYILRNITTNGTTTDLYLDGTAATQRLVVGNNSVWTFDILLAARRTDAVGGGAGYRFVGVLRKDGTVASTTLIGAVSKTVIGETDVPWDANCTANATNGDLRVSVNGQVGKTIRWVATVRTSEVTN